ncbi:MAG: AMP-binding protein, partial [Clostridia bacterium]
ICLGTTVCINNSLKYVIKNMKLFRPTAIVLVPLFVTTIYKKIESEIKKQNKEKLVKNSIALTKTVRHIGIDLRRIAFAKIHETLGGRLHTIICGGAALDPQYIEKFEDLGIAVYQGYGITECAPLVSVMPYYAKIKKTSVGIPISGSIIKIIGFDDNDGDEIDMDTGEIGEICVKGPHVMLGYYNNEAATAATFSKEGFFKTGDYGYVDDEGYIYITGRKKNIIIFDNGKNIYPEEIEEYLLRCDLICECAVIARVLDGEELLTAVVYPDYEKFLGRSDIEIKDEIKQAIMGINKTLPSFKQIRNIEIKKTEFEKTSSKKIIRYKI